MIEAGGTGPVTLSQRPEARGVPVLIRVATTNRDREIRKKAMFWLGQSDDPRALALFEDILTRPNRWMANREWAS